MKECNKCHRLLDLSQFYVIKDRPNQYRNRCKECARAYCRRWYYDKSDNDPEWMKQQCLKRKKLREKNLIKKRKHKHIRTNVHKKVRRAIRSGRLQKPSTCSQCGGDGFIEGHHADYDKPLEVEWLCTKCHGLLSRKGV